MRLIAIAMARDAADVLPSFLGHTLALVDELLIVDHGSADGTRDMLLEAAQRYPISYYRLQQEPFMQPMIMSALARLAMTRGADWVLPLDVDEFPLFPNRLVLEQHLAGASGNAACWQVVNAYPLERPQFDNFNAAGMYEVLRAPSRWRDKVVLRAGTPCNLTKGSHVTRNHNAHHIGRLLHIPLRHPHRRMISAAIGQRWLCKHLPAGMIWRRGPVSVDFNAPVNEDRERRKALAYPAIAEPDAPTLLMRFDPAGPSVALDTRPVRDAATVVSLAKAQSWTPIHADIRGSLRVQFGIDTVAVVPAPRA